MADEILQFARALTSEYFTDSYLFGEGCYEDLGIALASFGRGKKISFIMSESDEVWNKKIQEKLKLSLLSNRINIHGGIIRSARPGAPSDDVIRIATTIQDLEPNIVVCVGGESAINAAKIANAYLKIKAVSPKIESLEGEDKISPILSKTGKNLLPFLALQTSIGHSHLDNTASVYSAAEKRFIFIQDSLLRPVKAFSDSRWLFYLPPERVKDGALEAFSNCLETYICYEGEYLEYLEYACLLAMELVLKNIFAALEEDNMMAREAIALAADISAIALMTGKANCGHLNTGLELQGISRAKLCSILNPYYLIMYSNSIGTKLAKIAETFNRCGISVTGDSSDPRFLAENIASAILDLFRQLNMPAKLSECANLTEDFVIGNMMEDAKKNLVKNSFRNIPVELNLVNVNKYLRLVYEAAYTGDFSLIVNP